MKFKKLTATLLTATLVVANAMPVMAESAAAVTGKGAVEVDNSTDVEYYQVTVPALTAGNYDMTLDPTGQLKNFDSVTYAADKTVYFPKTKTKEKLDVAKTKGTGTGAKVQTKAYTEASSAEIKAFVTKATLDSDKNVTAVEVDDDKDYNLWVPDTDAGKEGLGKFLPLTASNVLTYFDVTATDATTITAVTMKANHLANGVICNGKVYKGSFTELTADCDLDAYDAYYDKDGNAIASADLETIDAVTEYTDTTNSLTVTNKSTKDLTLTATVTLNNAAALTINPSSTFAADDTAASLYVAVTDGTTTQALSKATEDSTTASGVIALDLAKASLTEITYQGGINSKTGGHDYKRYEDYGTTYDDASFYVTAAANGNSGAADAWATYAGTIQNEAGRPTLNVVYSIAEKVDSYTVTYNANYAEADPATATESVAANGHPTGSATAFTRDGYTLAGWATAADGEAAALSTYTVTEATTLYAIWTQDAAAPSIATTAYTYTDGESIEIEFSLGVGDKAATGVASVSTFKKDGVTVYPLASGTNYTISDGKIVFTAEQISALMNVDTKDFTITFNDSTPTVVTVTVSK